MSVPYTIPTEHERRALFAWLKQASSLTAWRRLEGYLSAFVEAVRVTYEEEQKTPGMRQLVPTSWFVDVLKCYDAYGAALEKLERGDRRCFAFLGARGHFSEGMRAVVWWQDMYGFSFSGRNGWVIDESPRWPEIMKAMHDCLAAYSDIGVVLQGDIIDNPAPIAHAKTYLLDPTSSLIKRFLAEPVLPNVPSVTPEVLVTTGKTIPFYGVWEPVRVKSFFNRQVANGVRYELPESWEVDGRILDGAMNYLHADSPAPTIKFKEDTARHDGRPTTWRLVWRDDRYGSAPIPEEEARYVFVQPVPGEVLFTYG